MPELYRRALRIRRAEQALGDGPMSWRPAPDGGLAFDRAPAGDPGPAGGGSGVGCLVNLSAGPVSRPDWAEVLLAGGPLDGGMLPAGTVVWLRIQDGPATAG
jgi:alpha-glucosidase